MLKFFANGKPGPVIISCLVVIGFITVLVLLIVKPIAFDNNAADLLKILTGTLSAMFGNVVQYHIGSSAGSRDKDNTLHAIVTNAANAAPAAGAS